MLKYKGRKHFEPENPRQRRNPRPKTALIAPLRSRYRLIGRPPLHFRAESGVNCPPKTLQQIQFKRECCSEANHKNFRPLGLFGNHGKSGAPAWPSDAQCRKGSSKICRYPFAHIRVPSDATGRRIRIPPGWRDSRRRSHNNGYLKEHFRVFEVRVFGPVYVPFLLQLPGFLLDFLLIL